MAADTYSPSLGAIEQGTGNNNNSWGTNLNGALTCLDTGIAGYVAYTVTGGNLAKDGVVPPAGPHPLGQMVVNLNGVLTANQTVTVPNVSKIWLVENACSGAFTLKFKTTAGAASVPIPQNGLALVVCDGNDSIFVGLSTALRDVQFTGPDGTLALPGLSFAAEPGTGLRRKSAGVMSLVVGGVEIATISATGIDVASGLAVTVGGVAPVPPGTEVNTAAIDAPTGWYFEYGQTASRSTDAPLMNAITKTFTADTNGTTVLQNVSKDLRNLGLEGSVFEAVGVPTNSKIVSIDSASQITMDNAATTVASGVSMRVFPYGNGDGATTFTLPDARGTVAAGRDNMGGTAANKLTTAGSGVNGLRLNTIGGAQNVTLARSDLPNVNATVAITDPGHSHNSDYPGISVGGSGSPVASSAAGTPHATTTSTTGITASVNLNGNVTQTTPAIVQPTRIRNVLIKR